VIIDLALNRLQEAEFYSLTDRSQKKHENPGHPHFFFDERSKFRSYPQLRENVPLSDMSLSPRPRVIVPSIVLVLAAAGVFTALSRREKTDHATLPAVPAVKNQTDPARRSAPALAGTKPPDFSHLPPAERINAETKARMEEAAAWREKLRNGSYSTLPTEAYPPGVPLHSSGQSP
jgi:hypothetical protein